MRRIFVPKGELRDAMTFLQETFVHFSKATEEHKDNMMKYDKGLAVRLTSSHDLEPFHGNNSITQGEHPHWSEFDGERIDSSDDLEFLL